jgi:hypothetical protein
LYADTKSFASIIFVCVLLSYLFLSRHILTHDGDDEYDISEITVVKIDIVHGHRGNICFSSSISRILQVISNSY